MKFKYLIAVFILSILCLLFLISNLSNSKRTARTSEILVVSNGSNQDDCKTENNTKAIYLGQRGSSGYSIKLKEAYTVNNNFYIILQEVIPMDGKVMQVVTYPCIELRIPKTKKTIEIRWE